LNSVFELLLLQAFAALRSGQLSSHSTVHFLKSCFICTVSRFCGCYGNECTCLLQNYRV